MKTRAVLVLLLCSASVCPAQNPEGNVPVCDPNATKPQELITGETDKYGPETRDYVHQIVLPKIQTYWYSVVPVDANPPLLRRGCLTVRFEILKNGTVAALKYVTSSGYVAMDRAAFGAVAGSSPFPPLPEAFKGGGLTMQIRFLYNPGFHATHQYAGSVTFPAGAGDVDLGRTIPLDTLTPARILHVVEPEYPKKAIKKKIQGLVVLNTIVDPNGKIASVSIVSGEPILTRAAADTVKNWTFEPFMKSGLAVRVQQSVKIEFRLGSKTGEPDFGFAPATVLEDNGNIQQHVAPPSSAASKQ